jgi:hypothetical protein
MGEIVITGSKLVPGGMASLEAVNLDFLSAGKKL